MGVRDLSEVVGLIYDSVVDRNACPVMLSRLADLLGATSGVQVGTYNSKTRLTKMLAPRLSSEELRSFSEYCLKITRCTRQHAVGAVIVPEALISRKDDCRTDIFEGSPNVRGPEATMGQSYRSTVPFPWSCRCRVPVRKAVSTQPKLSCSPYWSPICNGDCRCCGCTSPRWAGRRRAQLRS